MLKIEDLKKVDLLKDLSDDVINAIATLSKNDENTTIAAKTREIWDSIDRDVFEISGIEKGSRKSYHYYKEVFNNMKADNDDLAIYKAELNTAQDKLKSLEKELKNGSGDQALKNQISDLENKIKSSEDVILKLRGDIETNKELFDKEVSNHNQQMQNFQFNEVFNEALRGVKFKKDVPDVAINALIDSAKAKTLSTGVAKFVDVDGTKVINFYNEDDTIMTAGADKLRIPLTGKDVFIGHLKDVIEENRNQGGGGATGGGSGNQNYTTRKEAITGIRKMLADEGLVSGTNEFAKKQEKLFTEFGVRELPNS